MRHVFRGVAAVDQKVIEHMYANSGMYGYFLSCQTRLFLRESTFPLPLQNQLLDTFVLYYQISLISFENETVTEARNITYRAYGNFIEMIRVLFRHEWKDTMDRHLVGRAMIDAERMWPPDKRGFSFDDGSDERRLSDLASWPAKLLAKKLTTDVV